MEKETEVRPERAFSLPEEVSRLLENRGCRLVMDRIFKNSVLEVAMRIMGSTDIQRISQLTLTSGRKNPISLTWSITTTAVSLRVLGGREEDAFYK